jgi:hypothetical protein
MWFVFESGEDEYLNIPKCEMMGPIAVLWYKAYEVEEIEVKKELNTMDLPDDQIVAHEQLHKDGTHHTMFVVPFDICHVFTHFMKNGRGTNSCRSLRGPKRQDVR